MTDRTIKSARPYMRDMRRADFVRAALESGYLQNAIEECRSEDQLLAALERLPIFVDKFVGDLESRYERDEDSIAELHEIADAALELVDSWIDLPSGVATVDLRADGKSVVISNDFHKLRELVEARRRRIDG